jgi:MarR family
MGVSIVYGQIVCRTSPRQCCVQFHGCGRRGSIAAARTDQGSPTGALAVATGCRASHAGFPTPVREFNITPVQYSLLTTIGRSGELDQNSLALKIGLECTSAAEVVLRLQAAGCCAAGRIRRTAAQAGQLHAQGKKSGGKDGARRTARA